jgi:hypothetical protein
MKTLSTFFTILLSFCASAQITQNIRGKVVDMETRGALVGVKVQIVKDSSIQFKVGTELNGSFIIPDVPIGRHTIICTYIGYKDFIADINLSSGKETILTVEMEESISDMGDLVIKDDTPRGEAGNEMAMVSARRFSVEETDRYAGSRGDPARMASNYAGVSGTDDSRNDIVVRGNSPIGVLWQVEGIQIPNPNHFAIAGSQGGPQSILNNKVLSNGDFFTSAFPAEYGNSISAVFDLNFRNGNNQKHEFTGQFGVLGMEANAEGPINKDRGSSYLANYRYSTLGIFQAIGIDVGTDAIPKYQDAAFKLSFPTKNQGHWGVFGVGGLSDIAIKISDQKVPSQEFYGDNDRDQYFGTSMGVLGTRFSKSLNEDTYLSATLATSYQKQSADHDFIIRHIDSTSNEYVLDSLYPILGYVFQTNKIQLASSVTKKLTRQHVLKYGFNADMILYEYLDSTLTPSHNSFNVRWDAKGSTFLIQPYLQWKYKASDNLVLTTGLHALYFEQSNSFSFIEPRFGMKYKLDRTQSFNFGAGLHSQIQPMYTYFLHKTGSNGEKIYHNENMDLTKSAHLVLGYNKSFKSNLRVKSEVFYQYLYNVPVEVQPSAFSLVNQGSGFARFFPDSLQNEGTGTNYGLELTVEKFFDNSFFFLLTGSLYDSKYKGSDGIERNTNYNGNYVLNVLGGKEFRINKKNVLSLGAKVTWGGGKRYGLVDTTASVANNELIFLDQDFNEFQFRDYFRADFKINYKINAKKVSHEIALDFVNITGQQNILGISYTPDQPDGRNFRENYQLGFLPIFYYRIDF